MTEEEKLRRQQFRTELEARTVKFAADVQDENAKTAVAMIAPDTSTTLLRDLTGRADHPRWGEFVARYRPLMESYLRERFPSLEIDDPIQETFVAIAKALPDYRYDPDEKGHFHNYLTGILRYKALNALKRQDRHSKVVREYAADLSARGSRRI